MNAADSTAPARQEPLTWLARALAAALVAVVITWVARRTTWYLAIDQFGYLTFAKDLVHGRVLHEWPFLEVLRQFLPAGLDADVLGQTYVYHAGELFCRYAPGFPLILALVQIVFGPAATHLVNPVAAGLLLATLFWLGRRVLDSDWLGLGAALLVTLLPTYVLLWSISPLRDVPAHTFALAGLGVLVPVPGSRRSVTRWIVSGFLLGCTISTRIDAVLYAVPAIALAFQWRPWARRDILAGAAALLVGVLPLLTYNWIATGNPLRPTQAMELNRVLSSVDDRSDEDVLDAIARVAGPTRAHAQAATSVADKRAARLLQGGGLRLAHLRTTLPQNLDLYLSVFGPLGGALGCFGALAAVRRLPLFLLTVPYVVVSTLFFSLWTRPDPRYLAGSILLSSLLVIYGAVTVAAATDEARRRGVRTWVALGGAAVVIGLCTWGLGVPDVEEVSARPWATVALEGALAAALLVGVFFPGGRAKWVFAIVLGLSLSGVVAVRTSSRIGLRGSFQQEQVQIARETIEGATSDKALIITSSEIGRPAENINFYTDANAVYLREVTRWGVTPPYILDQALADGFEVYLLLPPSDARRWIESEFVWPWFEPEMVAEIPLEEARRWFVASPAHYGVPLWFVQMHRRPERIRAPAS
ncbi:MAG: hypothetical protein P8R42_22385 [Candidatus Binatia bacterium]|nr:hypothetical protein [Candidatus Binatia bacterium]